MLPVDPSGAATWQGGQRTPSGSVPSAVPSVTQSDSSCSSSPRTKTDRFPTGWMPEMPSVTVIVSWPRSATSRAGPVWAEAEEARSQAETASHERRCEVLMLKRIQHPQLPAVRAVVGREVEGLLGCRHLHGGGPGGAGGDVLDEPGAFRGAVGAPQLLAVHGVAGAEPEAAVPGRQA